MEITWHKLSPIHGEWLAQIDGKYHPTRYWKILGEDEDDNRFYLAWMDTTEVDEQEPDNEFDDMPDDFERREHRRNYNHSFYWHSVQEYDAGEDLIFRFSHMGSFKGAKKVMEELIQKHLLEMAEIAAKNEHKVIIEDE